MDFREAKSSARQQRAKSLRYKGRGRGRGTPGGTLAAGGPPDGASIASDSASDGDSGAPGWQRRRPGLHDDRHRDAEDGTDDEVDAGGLPPGVQSKSQGADFAALVEDELAGLRAVKGGFRFQSILEDLVDEDAHGQGSDRTAEMSLLSIDLKALEESLSTLPLAQMLWIKNENLPQELRYTPPDVCGTECDTGAAGCADSMPASSVAASARPASPSPKEIAMQEAAPVRSKDNLSSIPLARNSLDLEKMSQSNQPGLHQRHEQPLLQAPTNGIPDDHQHSIGPHASLSGSTASSLATASASPSAVQASVPSLGGATSTTHSGQLNKSEGFTQPVDELDALLDRLEVCGSASSRAGALSPATHQPPISTLTSSQGSHFLGSERQSEQIPAAKTLARALTGPAAAHAKAILEDDFDSFLDSLEATN
eukprot:SM000029S10558  [mRNA]  locus=s29:893788:895825:+ [translate_table: standard]